MLQTERLYLKSITPSVVHELFKTLNKQEIYDFFGFDDAGYERLKEMHHKGMETYNVSLHYFLIINKENNQPIGECGFHTWNKRHRRAELFYALRSDDVKRKGYMTEVLPKVLTVGFNEMNLHRIEALVASWNTPSLRLLERCGFTKEGTMREDYCVDGKNEDSDCYSLLCWEWENESNQGPVGI